MFGSKTKKVLKTFWASVFLLPILGTFFVSYPLKINHLNTNVTSANNASEFSIVSQIAENDQHYPREGEGICVGADYESWTIDILKTYFFTSEPQHIITEIYKNINDFFIVTNPISSERYEWKYNEEWDCVYNETLGALSLSQTYIGSSNPNYRLTFKHELNPQDQHLNQLKTASYSFALKKGSQSQMYTFKTLSGYNCDPNFHTVDTQTVGLHFNQDNQKRQLVWTCKNQTDYPYIYGNSFQYFNHNQWNLEIDTDQITDQRINQYFDFEDLIYDPDNNQLSTTVTIKKPAIDNLVFEVLNLKWVVLKNNQKYAEGELTSAFLYIDGDKFNSNVTLVDNLVEYDSEDLASLRYEYDKAEFTLLVPYVLLTSLTSYEQLITLFSTKFKDEQNGWNWVKQEANASNEYHFAYENSKQGHKFKYLLDFSFMGISNNLGDNANPMVRFDFDLTQMNDGFEENQIQLTFNHNHQKVAAIEVNKYITPPTPVQPDDNSKQKALILGSTLGSLTFIGIIVAYIAWKFNRRNRVTKQKVKF